DVSAGRRRGAGARLDGAGADGLVADPAEQLSEALDGLFVGPVDGLGGHVAAGQARAAGGDDRVDFGIVDPVVEAPRDDVGVVLLDGPRGEAVAGGLDTLG